MSGKLVCSNCSESFYGGGTLEDRGWCLSESKWWHRCLENRSDTASPCSIVTSPDLNDGHPWCEQHGRPVVACLDALRKDRDDARAYGEQLYRMAREVTCVWCGFQFKSTLGKQAEELREHAKACEGHPVRQQRALVEEAGRYVKHSASCSIQPWEGGACDCGLADWRERAGLER